MDNGESNLHGYRVQYNITLGRRRAASLSPGRDHLDEVTALAAG